jgi:hypothetical protein
VDTEEKSIVDKLSYKADCELTQGDTGKCILYFLPEEGTVCFAVSKMDNGNPHIQTDDQKSLRKLFRNTQYFKTIAGKHGEIKRPEESIIMGGAAYKVLEGDELFVDSDSADHGSVQLDILKRCVEGMGLEVVILSMGYMSRMSAEEYLQRRVGEYVAD